MNDGMKKIDTLLKKSKIPIRVRRLFMALDRSFFFDSFYSDLIYTGSPVPLVCGQESDDVAALAKMLTLADLKKTHRLLEIGTGSGYSAALMADQVKELVTVERIPQLAKEARERVLSSGRYNVRFFVGDATEPGLIDELGLFDVIIVTAACVHRPYALCNVLKDNGRIVFPMGPAHGQQITRLSFVLDKNKEKKEEIEFFDYCRYDSIRGACGWYDYNGVAASSPEEEE